MSHLFIEPVAGEQGSVRLTFSEEVSVTALRDWLFPGGAPGGVDIDIDMSGPGRYVVRGITQSNILHVNAEYAEQIAQALGLDNRVTGGPTASEEPNTVNQIGIWLKAFIPYPWIDIPATGRYSGDNRGFSYDRTASARMHSEIRLDISDQARASGDFGIRQIHYCDESHELNPDTGEILVTDSGDSSRMLFSMESYDPHSAMILLNYSGAANLPLINHSPDINMEGTFRIALASRTVVYDVSVDSFPAFEGYFLADDDPHLLFQYEEDSPILLPGGAGRTVSHWISF